MDQFSKKLLKELEQMQQQSGRILRSMSIARMIPAEGRGWQPAVDIYETENEYLLYAELAGTDSDSLQVVVEGQSIRISGLRQLSGHPSIACIHQLEMELGPFQRTLTLPGAIELDEVHSTYSNGVLQVVLPKKGKKPRRTISIQSGE